MAGIKGGFQAAVGLDPLGGGLGGVPQPSDRPGSGAPWGRSLAPWGRRAAACRTSHCRAGGLWRLGGPLDRHTKKNNGKWGRVRTRDGGEAPPQRGIRHCASLCAVLLSLAPVPVLVSGLWLRYPWMLGPLCRVTWLPRFLPSLAGLVGLVLPRLSVVCMPFPFPVTISQLWPPTAVDGKKLPRMAGNRHIIGINRYDEITNVRIPCFFAQSIPGSFRTSPVFVFTHRHTNTPMCSDQNKVTLSHSFFYSVSVYVCVRQKKDSKKRKHRGGEPEASVGPSQKKHGNVSLWGDRDIDSSV